MENSTGASRRANQFADGGEFENLWRLGDLMPADFPVLRQRNAAPLAPVADDNCLAAAVMRRPVAVETAYKNFGLMLGVFPPAAIFYQMFGSTAAGKGWALALLLVMNLVCAVVGYAAGGWLASAFYSHEREAWWKMMLTVPLLGMLWGLLTGIAGGLLFFGIGAIGGAICAVPVGMAAFTIFAILHRRLERGGFIERGQYLPVAFGISLTIAAFILGLGNG